MAAPKSEKEQRFDQVKLQAMHEPLTIRVEKMRGNVRQPIELPAKGSEQNGFSPPGTNWTREEVLQLENFILTKWAGGGYYEFTVTDAKGDTMRWQGVWDPRMYPEKVPPNTQEAALIGAATNVQAVSGPAVVPPSVQPLGMGMATGWPPNGAQLGYGNPPHTGPVMGAPPAQAPAQPPMPQAPPMFASQPMWPGAAPQQPWGFPQQQPAFNGFGPTPGFGYPPGYGYPQQPPFGGRSRFGYDDDDRSRRGARFFDDDDKEKKELERRLVQADLERKELEYKQAIERQQIAHEQQMAAMREEIRRLGEGRNKTEDVEIQRMREERERERERNAAEAAAMQQKLQEARAEQARRDQELAMQMMRQQHEQSMAAMREQLASIAAGRSESSEFQRLREEQERQRQEFERQRQEQERRLEMERAERERERERHEQQRRDEMLQREMKETREASERRFEQMQAAAMSNRQDPVIEMMKENARMNADVQREVARLQNESAARMSQFMVPPVQLAQIMKDNASGSDGMIRGIIQSVGEIGNLYKNAAETIMNMSGGGGDPPAARLIQEGMGRASDVVERFLSVKRDQVISEAKVKQAEAARDQTRIQAEVALRTGMVPGGQRPPVTAGWTPPPPVANARPQQPQPGSGLNGAAPAANTNGAPKTVGPIDPYAAQAQAPAQPTGAIDPYAPPPPPPNNTGPSEEEVFGPALESVHRLRRGVAEGKLTPDKTVDAILQGVNYVMTNQLVVPAFTLFQETRWADFIDIMLPAATSEFKAECVRILIEEVEQDDSPGGDGDDDAPGGGDQLALGNGASQ